MEISIQPLNNFYAGEVSDLILAIQQKEFNIPISLQDQPDLLAIEDFYMTGGGNFWGVFVNEELAGTIALIKFNADSGAIRKMFVKKQFRGKELHLAQRLLDNLITYCQRVGIENLLLGTAPVLKAAQRFYERNHFELVEKSRLPQDFPLMHTDRIFYSRKITK